MHVHIMCALCVKCPHMHLHCICVLTPTLVEHKDCRCICRHGMHTMGCIRSTKLTSTKLTSTKLMYCCNGVNGVFVLGHVHIHIMHVCMCCCVVVLVHVACASVYIYICVYVSVWCMSSYMLTYDEMYANICPWICLLYTSPSPRDRG